MSSKVAALWSAALVVGALVAGCGSDGGDDGGGSATAAAEAPAKIDGAKVIDPASMDDATGDVTFCTGKDTSGDSKALVERFNAANPEITAKLLEFSTSADEQRAQFVQRQEAKSSECDVFDSDVIWTAEFATQKWLYDMTPYLESKKSALIPSTLASVDYAGRLWGAPQSTAAALLYYRTDQVKTPPETWQDVYRQAAANDGIVYQGAPTETVTCDYLEIAFAAGGKVLSEDGKKSEINSPENLQALQLMVDGIKDGTAADGVTTYQEEEARRYWEAGKATFMRNWSYAYALGQMKGSKVAGKFDVMPLPAFEGAGKAAILGGHNFVISVYSKNPGAALKLIDFALSPEFQKSEFLEFAEGPTLAAVYDDPEVQEKYPFASQLKESISQAKARPVSPVYPQISQAIYENVNAALSGTVSAADALKTADDQINEALATF